MKSIYSKRELIIGMMEDAIQRLEERILWYKAKDIPCRYEEELLADRKEILKEFQKNA